MHTYLCCVYNKSTGHHSVPLIFETKEQAATVFVNETLADNSEIFNIKDNLEIYCLGEYEHKTGKIKQYWKKKLLLKGSEIVQPVQTKKENV